MYNMCLKIFKRKDLSSIIGSCIGIFWPGALIFGFPGVMGPYWRNILNVSRESIGYMMFFMLAAVGIFMFIVGKFQERIGIKKTMGIGALLSPISLFFILKVKSIIFIYIWAFIIGAVSCFVYIPALTSVQSWFPEKKGLVSGIVNLTFAISAAIMSPIFGWLLKKVGYSNMIVIFMVLSFLFGIIGAILTDLPWKTGTIKRDIPDHILKSSLSVKEALKTKSFWFMWFVWLMQGAAGISMVTLSIPYGIKIGLAASAVTILVIFNLMSGISRIIAGVISDKIKRNILMSIVFFLAGLSYLSMHFLPKSMIFIPVAIIGFSFGTLFAVSAPLAVECFGIAHFGAIFGMLFTAYGFFAGILGPSLSGYILDVTNENFLLVFIYLGLFCVISSFLILFVRDELYKTKKN